MSKHPPIERARVEVTIDPSDKTGGSWMVFVDGRVCSPRWNSKGAALAYVAMLERGARKPEFN